MTLNCIHVFIVTGGFLYWCVMRPASQRFFIYSCIHLRILIISYLATFLGTNGLSMLMCRKAINQINKLIYAYLWSASELEILNINGTREMPYMLPLLKAFKHRRWCSARWLWPFYVTYCHPWHENLRGSATLFVYPLGHYRCNQV